MRKDGVNERGVAKNWIQKIEVTFGITIGATVAVAHGIGNMDVVMGTVRTTVRVAVGVAGTIVCPFNITVGVVVVTVEVIVLIGYKQERNAVNA
jgi:hypothetical protein